MSEWELQHAHTSPHSFGHLGVSRLQYLISEQMGRQELILACKTQFFSSDQNN
jgi:hypothetical protein